MFFRTTPAAAEAVDVISRSTRTWSSSSNGSRVSSSSLSSGMSSNGSGACEHQQDGSAGDSSEEAALVVGVAVGKEVKECKANLMWVLSNLDAVMITGDKTAAKRKATVVLLHAHRPAKTIPFMGANFPAEQLHESEVSAFRQAETQAMNCAMAKYRAMCAKVKVQAVCKVVETTVDGDVAQAILRLVAQHGIRHLVVGAAADKRYSSKMRAPSSRTATTVQQQAHPLCAIWFVCKGNLVCTRWPAGASGGAAVAATETTSAESHSQQHDHGHAATTTYRTSKRDDEVVQLGTFIQSLRRNNDVGEPEEPPPPPSVPHRLHAEAEVLRREQQRERSSEQHVAALEAEVASYKRVIQDLQEKLSEAHCMLFSLEREQEDLRRQRDAALRDKLLLLSQTQQLMELSYEEVLEATQNLDETLRLRGTGGGYGAVYRAVLRRGDEVVAVKVLNCHPAAHEGFQQQVEELSKLRHPNLVPLLGFCSAPDQALALVYEYLPGGSLEDRLATLGWPERTRIAAEVRSALAFLHRNNTVHGHLNPANVLLLEEDLDAMARSATATTTTAKLSDSGLCRLLSLHEVLRCTLSASTAPYMDPEFLASGELRPASDAYAFGVLLLRLLTGRPPMGLARQVQAALLEGTTTRVVLTDILDPSAGEWPYAPEQAEQLAHLALSCCNMASHNRPDLAADETVAHTLECFLRP